MTEGQRVALTPQVVFPASLLPSSTNFLKISQDTYSVKASKPPPEIKGFFW
jgi:hypothetical protein